MVVCFHLKYSCIECKFCKHWGTSADFQLASMYLYFLGSVAGEFSIQFSNVLSPLYKEVHSCNSLQEVAVLVISV